MSDNIEVLHVAAKANITAVSDSPVTDPASSTKVRHLCVFFQQFMVNTFAGVSNLTQFRNRSQGYVDF